MSLSIPHIFVNGVIAEAAEVNANFTSVKVFVDGVAAGTNLAVGAVATAAIADGAVTTAKLASAAVTADKLAPGAGGGSPLEIQVFS
jgi:hypothetical protein